MAAYKRAKVATATNATSITATFDESTPVDATHTLFAVVFISGIGSDFASNSWGAPALAGSASNGGNLYILGLSKQGDNATNSLTVTFTETQAVAYIHLYALEGYVSATPVQVKTINQTSLGTSIPLGPLDAATATTNNLVVGAVATAGGSGGFGAWPKDSFDAPDIALDGRMVSGVRALPATGQNASTSVSWTTGRNARSVLWQIRGIASSGATGPELPTTEILDPVPNQEITTNSYTIKARATSASGVASLRFYDNGTIVPNNAIRVTGTPQDGVWYQTVDLSSASTGARTFSARATDTLGNQTAALAAGSVTVAYTKNATTAGALKLGLLPIKKMHVGGTAIKRALLNGGVVWSASTSTTTPPVDPPVTSGPLTQATMPTTDQAWAPGEIPTFSYSSTATVTGGDSALPTDSRVARLGYATKGLVASATSGYWRSGYLADKDSAGTAPDANFLPMWGMKVKTDSNVLEIKLKQRDGISGMTGLTTRFPVRIKIDGKWVTRRPIFLGPNNIGYENITPSFITDNTQFYLKMTFATAVSREVEIFLLAECGGFAVPSGKSISTATAPKHKAVIIGDSLPGAEKHGVGNYSLNGAEGGLQKATYNHLSSVWSYICQTLGYDNPINLASGSTGFAISGDTINYASATRLAEVDALDPELIVVGTALNDLQNGVSTATVQTNATNLMNTLKTTVPNAIRIILGCPTPPSVGGTAGESVVAPYNTALRNAAAATGTWFIDPAKGDLYSPAGVVVIDNANMMTGNEKYISDDGTHPTQAGSDFFGSGYLASFIKAAHPAGSVVVTPPDSGPPVYVPPTNKTLGPQYLNYTPKTVPRNQSARKAFYAANCTSAEVQKAMGLASVYASDNPTHTVDVLLPAAGNSVPGVLQGSGTGSTSTPWIDNTDGRFNHSNANRIRVRPADGYGSIEIRRGTTMAPPGQVGGKTTGALNATYGLRFKALKGYTFSEIEGNESAILLSGCSDIGMEYMDNLQYWGVMGVTGFPSKDVDLTALMYRRARIKNGDGAALDTTGDTLTNFTMRNMFMAPIYIGEEATWNFKSDGKTPDKPHSDTIQEKSNSGKMLYGWNTKDSILYAAYNTIFQLGGTTNDLDVEGSYLIGGSILRDIFPPQPNEYCNYYDSLGGATFQIFNGNGISPHHSRTTYADGNMGALTFSNPSADIATSLSASESKTGWTKVTPKTKAEVLAAAPIPPAGKTLWASRA